MHTMTDASYADQVIANPYSVKCLKTAKRRNRAFPTPTTTY